LPKAGKYDYPFFDIDHCIDRLRDYYEIVRTDETKRELVAENLGMSITGGGFAYLISSMEKYGLIRTGGGNVTITESGKTILYGEPSEVERMRRKAVSSIDLFRELHEQFGDDVNQEQIRAFLRQKANVDISKAQKIAEKVDKIYKNVSNYIIPAKKLAPPSESRVSSIGRRETITQTEIGKEPLKIQKGGLYIEIPSDAKILENIEFAKDFLTFMEGKLKKGQGKKQTN
jgi:hypothetical protein